MNHEIMPEGIQGPVMENEENSEPSVLEQDMPLSPEAEEALSGAQLTNVDTQIENNIAEEKATEDKIALLRSELGLSESETVPPSIQGLRDDREGFNANKATLVHEQLIRIEKKRIGKSRLQKLIEALSGKNDSSFVVGLKIMDALFGKNKTEEEKKTILNKAKKFLNDGGLEDSKDIPQELLRELEEGSQEEAEKIAATIEASGQADEYIKNAELPIGYEGGEYTPEGLLEEVEGQNKAAESVSDAPKYDAGVQAN